MRASAGADDSGGFGTGGSRGSGPFFGTGHDETIESRDSKANAQPPGVVPAGIGRDGDSGGAGGRPGTGMEEPVFLRPGTVVAGHSGSPVCLRATGSCGGIRSQGKSSAAGGGGHERWRRTLGTDQAGRDRKSTRLNS